MLYDIECDDILGTTGTISVLTAYALTTNELVEEKVVMDALNMYGSLTIGYNCWCKKTYPPLVLQVAWFSIAAVSFVNRFI